MECIFLNAAGTTLFVRDDMESGHWVQEQMNLTADFPFDAGKVIQKGQRIAFRDPATNTLEVFEIIVVTNNEPDHFQQITAEHICISELSDEHINSQKITDKTAAQALGTALTGTLWSVGNNTASGTQSADFSRGSAWDAVGTIQQNWNVYITPRVVITNGAISGRYLDISPAQGTWRGLRLSLRKNFLDPVVTYDESEVYTALYGYGGSVDVPQTTGDDKTEELTFKDIAWSATSAHPAKPSGQTYLEWPEKTALYGRNGRARFGYYQNGNIKDANLLLEKTWESLQKSCEPKISIAGSCVDLARMGYTDQPIRLHDTVIVEIEETGEAFQKQIICCDIDLIDPTGSRVEIGDYVQNIVYINRDTDKKASGGGGGSGRGKGSMTKLEDEDSDFQTWFEKTNEMIGMVLGKKNGDGYIKIGEICLALNDSQESIAYINADHINISGTQTAHMLAGSIVYDANGNLVLKESSGAGVLVERSGTAATFGIWDRGNLTGGVMVQEINGQTGTIMTLSADVIDIQGVVTALASEYISCIGLSVDGGNVEIGSGATHTMDVYGDIGCSGNIAAGSDGTVSGGTASFINFNDGSSSHAISWKSQTVITSVGVTNITKDFALADGTSWNHNVVTQVGKTDTTIHYLGY